MLALGYPFWPLAALALLNPKRSPAVRRHALQALGLNFGTVGLWLGLAIVAHLPIIGLSAWPLAALLAPIWVAAVVYYGFSVWHGSEVRVPLVSDWLDEHDDDSRVASTR